MKRHDYGCPIKRCRRTLRDHLAPIDAASPTCPTHKVPMEIHWAGLSNRTGRQTFEPMTVEGHDGKPVTLDSMRAIRKFEKSSLEHGHQPQILRNFTQDRSNKDVNTFGKPVFPKIKTHSKRGVPFVTPGPRIPIDPSEFE